MLRAAVAIAYSPLTEKVLCNAASQSGMILTGGSLPTILADGSDSTFVGTGGNVTSLDVTSIGFADLVNHTGRGILSFAVSMRHLGSSTFNNWSLGTFTGVTPSPTSATHATQNAIATDVTSFTKSGGGSWTPAQVNSLTCRFQIAPFVSSQRNLYEISLTATYG